MIKLIMAGVHEWKEGEVLRIKVLRIFKYAEGRWELVIEILEGGLKHES